MSSKDLILVWLKTLRATGRQLILQLVSLTKTNIRTVRRSHLYTCKKENIDTK